MAPATAAEGRYTGAPKTGHVVSSTATCRPNARAVSHRRAPFEALVFCPRPRGFAQSVPGPRRRSDQTGTRWPGGPVGGCPKMRRDAVAAGLRATAAPPRGRRRTLSRPGAQRRTGGGGPDRCSRTGDDKADRRRSAQLRPNARSGASTAATATQAHVPRQAGAPAVDDGCAPEAISVADRGPAWRGAALDHGSAPLAPVREAADLPG